MKPIFDTARSLLGSLDQLQVDAINAILSAWKQYGDGDNRKLAYILATGTHESGFKPISENLTYSSAARIHAVWPKQFPTVESAKPYVKKAQKLGNKVYGGRLGNTEPNDGWDYRGRGPSQLTGKENYKKFSALIGVDLVDNPDFAKSIDPSAKILVIGLLRGLFTGKKLSDYITSSKADYTNARACVNGDVKANGAKIAGYAVKYEEALKEASYAPPESPIDLPDETPSTGHLGPKQPDDPGIVLEPLDPPKRSNSWMIGAVILIAVIIAIFVFFVPIG